MKKKYILLSVIILVLVVFSSFKLGVLFEKKNSESISIKREIPKGTISMMLETGANTDTYEMTTASSWPTSGYKFNSKLSKCENGGKVSWDYNNKRVKMSGVSTDKCYIYFDKIVTVDSYCASGDNLASCIKTYGNAGYDKSSIYIHNSNLTNGAGDNSYRFAGASDYVNNFVCFGSDAEICPTDNLYRIIGVFDDKVKLIKYDYATSALLGTDGDYASNNYYYWNYKSDTSINSGYGSNLWSTSLLNKTNLNINFINNIGNNWASRIAVSTWKVGGNTQNNLEKSIVSNIYQNEIENPANNNTMNSKIGLMYLSDYGYAASKNNWGRKLGSDNLNGYSNPEVVVNNWMYTGKLELTITPLSENSRDVFRIDSDGDVFFRHASYNLDFVRPCFYLKDSITYFGGKGTKENPVRLS